MQLLLPDPPSRVHVYVSENWAVGGWGSVLRGKSTGALYGDALVFFSFYLLIWFVQLYYCTLLSKLVKCFIQPYNGVFNYLIIIFSIPF